MRNIIPVQIAICTVGCSFTLDITIKISNPHQINSKVTFDNEISKNKNKQKRGFCMDTRNVNGLSHERLYQVYNGMISRCYNKNHPHYDLWGGRGITVCDEWRTDYQSFRKWAYENGYDDKRDRKVQSLDRIDNNGNYSPENCRWTTMKEQRKNQRRREVSSGYKYNWTFEGITKSAIEWCAIFNVSVPMVMYRVNEKNMRPFEALITPVTRGKNSNSITKEQVLELRDKGMTNKQISEMLSCSETTVRRRLGKRC